VLDLVTIMLMGGLVAPGWIVPNGAGIRHQIRSRGLTNAEAEAGSAQEESATKSQASLFKRSALFPIITNRTRAMWDVARQSAKQTARATRAPREENPETNKRTCAMWDIDVRSRLLARRRG
jgi:hypothetical protein